MVNINDSFKFTKDEKILTSEYHMVKGLTLSYRVIHKASEAIDMHYHANSIEIFCLAKGNRIINVNGKCYTVRGNELFVLFPNEAHSTSYYTQSPGKFFGIRVDLSDENNLLGLNEKFSCCLIKLLLSLERHYKLAPDSLALIENAMSQYCMADDVSRCIATSYISNFLFTIKHMQPISGASEVDGNIKKALAYIECNYQSQIKVEQLAAASCLSLSHFKNKFKDSMGMTPSEYVSFIKIEAAKQSLSNSDIAITALAYDLGFCSSDYFSTVFKKFVQLSPNEFRREALNNKNTIFKEKV